MLEFVIVMPLYLFMLGLLFIYGEVVLFSNRILQSNRILAYVNASSFSQILDGFIKDEDNGVSLFDVGGITKESDYTASSGNYTSKTDFGKLKGAYAYADEIGFPSGMQGLLLLPAILEDPKSAKTEWPKLSLGKEAQSRKCLMHWNLLRNETWNKHNGTDVRKPMGKLVGSKRSCDEMRYYEEARDYSSHADSCINSYPVIMAHDNNAMSWGTGFGFGSSPERRYFGSFFSGSLLSGLDLW